MAARGHLVADERGHYRFWAITPTPYPIPHDGPVGALLASVGRSPMRASHLHFDVRADGKRTLITHIFVRGDELLTRDAVFGVKESAGVNILLAVIDFATQVLLVVLGAILLIGGLAGIAAGPAVAPSGVWAVIVALLAWAFFG